MNKKNSRLKRAKKLRIKIKESLKHRLVVHRSSRHIYAQIINPDSCVIASSSTLSADYAKSSAYTGNINSAVSIGKDIAQKALSKGIKVVAFDRSGFKYHGRIAALANSARDAGLQF